MRLGLRAVSPDKTTVEDVGEVESHDRVRVAWAPEHASAQELDDICDELAGAFPDDVVMVFPSGYKLETYEIVEEADG